MSKKFGTHQYQTIDAWVLQSLNSELLLVSEYFENLSPQKIPTVRFENQSDNTAVFKIVLFCMYIWHLTNNTAVLYNQSFNVDMNILYLCKVNCVAVVLLFGSKY